MCVIGYIVFKKAFIFSTDVTLNCIALRRNWTYRISVVWPGIKHRPFVNLLYLYRLAWHQAPSLCCLLPYWHRLVTHLEAMGSHFPFSMMHKFVCVLVFPISSSLTKTDFAAAASLCESVRGLKGRRWDKRQRQVSGPRQPFRWVDLFRYFGSRVSSTLNFSQSHLENLRERLLCWVEKRPIVRSRSIVKRKLRGETDWGQGWWSSVRVKAGIDLPLIVQTGSKQKTRELLARDVALRQSPAILYRPWVVSTTKPRTPDPYSSAVVPAVQYIGYRN